MTAFWFKPREEMMARVGIFLALLLLVAVIGAGAALLVVDVTPPVQTIEKAVPDARLSS